LDVYPTVFETLTFKQELLYGSPSVCHNPCIVSVVRLTVRDKKMVYRPL